MKANKNIQNEKLIKKKIILSRVVAHFSRENEQTRENLIYKEEEETIQHESERGAVEVGSIYIKQSKKQTNQRSKQTAYIPDANPAKAGLLKSKLNRDLKFFLNPPLYYYKKHNIFCGGSHIRNQKKIKFVFATSARPRCVFLFCVRDPRYKKKIHKAREYIYITYDDKLEKPRCLKFVAVEYDNKCREKYANGVLCYIERIRFHYILF